MERFAKGTMPSGGVRLEILQAWLGRIGGQKYKKKKPCMEPFLVFFLQDTLKTTFSIANLTQRWAIRVFFFQNQDFFSISERAGRLPLSVQVARLYARWLRRVPNMSDYGSIQLNNA